MNFCDACLDPSVSVNKPEADGREVKNLISQDSTLRKSGYMGEYFIRPPVDITVTFKVPIDVSHIKLCVTLDRKCSTGFAIFTQPEEIVKSKDQKNESNSSQNAESSSLSLEPLVAKSVCAATLVGCANSFSDLECHPDPVNSEDSNDVFFCVGTFFTQNEECVVLRNHHYRHWINVKMPDSENGQGHTKVYKGALKHANRLALRCIKSMMIRITKTVGGVPPALQAMEIWGQPGISTKKTLRKEIVRKWYSRVHAKDSTIPLPRIYNSVPDEEMRKTSVEEPSQSKDSFEIPEDFLDPLTCDIMTVPLLLPSGHSIDADTLDKFIASEGVWGRPASDPFTGVPFKSGQMPSPNFPLKSRIDRFILLNAEHPQVQMFGRTLASSSKSLLRVGLVNNDSSLVDSEQHNTHYSTKRKLDTTGTGVKSDNHSDENAREKVTRKDVLNCKSGTAKYNCESYTSGISGMDNSSTCKSQSAGTFNSAKNQSLDELSGIVGQNEIKCAKSDRSSHLEIPRQVRYQGRKHQQYAIPKKTSSSSHHGLVHMIGSALSSTHQRADMSKSQSQRSLGKPTSLIQGDAKPEKVNALDLASKNSASCQCGNKNDLYSLLCKHLLCRSCLLQQKQSEVTCAMCGQQCKRADIMKYHKKSIFFVD